MKIHLTDRDLTRVRDDIIGMQQWVASNEPDSKDPTIRELVNNLFRTRCSVERLMLEKKD
jgi:hypothetical protein